MTSPVWESISTRLPLRATPTKSISRRAETTVCWTARSYGLNHCDVVIQRFCFVSYGFELGYRHHVRGRGRPSCECGMSGGRETTVVRRNNIAISVTIWVQNLDT